MTADGAVIFDFDGTIADTESADFLAWTEVFGSYGGSLSLDLWSTVIGSTDSGWRPHVHLSELVGRSIDADVLYLAQRTRYLQALDGLTALPGVVDLIVECSRLGVPLGVASSSNRDWVVSHLTTLGIVDRFDTIRCKEDVQKTKPDPALFLLACHDLDVEPAKAVAIEDSPNGAKAALAAGLTTVVVPNSITRGFVFPPCTIRESLHGMTVASLFSLRAS